ncbi:MAG: hypothetical protein EA343_07255 [Nodularia sp. (in: Bacteria)]|nr:MAG: hypothetical protein EA343_07255 [Nodularia sp. (in: cyanobacteria)]
MFGDWRKIKPKIKPKSQLNYFVKKLVARSHLDCTDEIIRLGETTPIEPIQSKNSGNSMVMIKNFNKMYTFINLKFG